MTSTDQKTSNISIIIPTLNEEENIPFLFENIGNRGHELILVDGGSTDGTCKAAVRYGFTLLQCSGGRGAQLNAGAKQAEGPILVFLHADTRLPDNFEEAIYAGLNNKEVCCGGFKLNIAQATPAMRFVCFWANLRGRILQMIYGDQAIFLTKATFMEMGMFPQTPIMEDFIFIRTAKKRGKVILLHQAVSTSARRWRKKGVLRTTLINQIIVIGYYCGVSLKRLSSLYRG